jgi:hypothetical protein
MRPVVHRGRQPDWAPKDFGGEEKSLYAKWSRTCWRRQFDLRELHRVLGHAPLGRNVLCAAFMDGKSGALGEYAPFCAMIGLSSAAFYHAIGHDLFRWEVRAGVTTTLLRYCAALMLATSSDASSTQVLGCQAQRPVAPLFRCLNSRCRLWVRRNAFRVARL